MPEQEAPYDPYIPSGQPAAQQGQAGAGNARTQALQAVRNALMAGSCFLVALADLG